MQVPTQVVDAITQLHASSDIGALNEAMDTLPPDQREVLVLKEFEGLKFKEIADIIGCPESTVKSRMYYGLRSLRNQLEQRGFAAEAGR